MRHLVQAIAISVAALTLSATGSVAETLKLQVKDSMHINSFKRLDVHGPRQFKRVLSSRTVGDSGGVVECQPVDSKWCNDGFTKFCAESNGIGTTEPDGSVICTYSGRD
ncbi:MAG: hypothetical protein ABJO09_04330 [Hyphomicrobiales bacterium]